jgi:hypothetical protein
MMPLRIRRYGSLDSVILKIDWSRPDCPSKTEVSIFVPPIQQKNDAFPLVTVMVWHLCCRNQMDPCRSPR